MEEKVAFVSCPIGRAPGPDTAGPRRDNPDPVNPLRVLAATLALAGAALPAVGAFGQERTPAVPSIELSGEISPATESWVGSALSDAADDDAPLAIIRLDTPGGLGSSMREIVKDVIAAPMPVVVYVTPSGAQAASAGVFVTQAADVAAMAPETNIGSASPITLEGEDIGGTLGEKVTNDAAAFARALAVEHGRNGELAERTVTEAENVTADEALDAELVDLVAADVDDLLAQLDGYEVQGPKAATLDTSSLEVEDREMPFRFDVLQFLVDPNVAYLLLLIGLVGIALEVFSPGAIVPGAIGSVALIAGLIGAAQLPVEAIGVVLLVIGIALIVAEAHLPTLGMLGIAGVGALIAGGLLLFDSAEGESVSPVLVVVVALALGVPLILIGQRALAARHEPVRTGEEDLVGALGDVRAALDPIGQVFVHGALWRARSADAKGPIEVGYRVRVEQVDGLTLLVRPVEEQAEGVS